MTTPVLQRRGGRLAVSTALAGTVLIALGAFWLSFTALADLARRSGISEGQAWAWPLIVDGIIVVATVSVVALAGHRAAWYPWMLLAAGALVSVTANAIHAVIAADADVPGLLAASVAAVPPLVLLAITHLTVILTRPIPPAATPTATHSAPSGSTGVTAEHDDDVSALSLDSGEHDRRAVAAGLREQGWSNKRIATHFGVHPSTVGRWLPQPLSITNEQETSP
ncbi:DUF2637 domain-containing protein [Corynebacterium striatum]|nr:DUF2637 domain-containing protein [Corynebacterium striatum]HCG2984866.1 DUF2637 domain-containing protein [Corynebacterium striatum]HCG3000870.1 DUF2637 domain-containing protein [Corynebacterium striatum]HCG3011080.1 DUF2637 domain-containing protein [Corynebacterium striatum]HCG3016488.1 DUF2637 domain-containing protein [Corynebacterium striatum]